MAGSSAVGAEVGVFVGGGSTVGAGAWVSVGGGSIVGIFVVIRVGDGGTVLQAANITNGTNKTAIRIRILSFSILPLLPISSLSLSRG